MTPVAVLTITALAHIVAFLVGAYGYYRLICKAISTKEES